MKDKEGFNALKHDHCERQKGHKINVTLARQMRWGRSIFFNFVSYRYPQSTRGEIYLAAAHYPHMLAHLLNVVRKGHFELLVNFRHLVYAFLESTVISCFNP